MKKRFPLTEERFWSLVDKRSEEECWVWKGSIGPRGYGTWGKRTAHVASYKFAIGPIVSNLQVKHTCRNRPCVNPAHLFLAPVGCPKGNIAWNKGIKILPEERFWEKVDKSGGPDACWLWRAYISKDGYGQFTENHTPCPAHRWIYIFIHGTLSSTSFVCHNCPGGDNKLCVNPKHLWLGNVQENTKDAIKKGQIRRGEIHPMVKLTEGQVLYIKSILVLNKFTHREISLMFNVSKTAVDNINTGKTWSYIVLPT